jgi:cellulose synthase/poly-beta-1,6-N-acetylglucosamine synthase-like glycosyltransferase
MNVGDIIIYIAIFVSIYTTVYFFLTLLDYRKEIRKTNTLKSFPGVTIVIPAYNEEETLAGTIDSVLNLDYPKDKLKIIIVDDGSTDKTPIIGKKYAKLENVSFYSKPNGGKHTALNLALDKCTTEYVGSLDADSYVDKNALKRIMLYFEDDEQIMAVTPAMKIYNPQTVLQHIQRVEFLIGILLRKVFSFLESIHVTPGPFTIYKKEFFKKYGYYRKAHQTEDIEIALRIQAKNYRIENCVDAFVYTHGPKKFIPLKKQRIRWYIGFLSNVMDYKELFKREHGTLGLFVLPMSLISVGMVITLGLYAIFRVFESTYKTINNYLAINFDIINLRWFNFELFYLSTRPLAILGLFGLILSITMLIITKKISKENKSIIKSYIYFILFYWILFGYWWAVAIINKIRKKKLTWSHKSE